MHFENTNNGSKTQLKETLKFCDEKGIKPIIAGDFNMKVVEDLKEIAEEDYFISYMLKPYKSFYPTNFSHDKVPITLDYILSHKKKFKMGEINCMNVDISDHKPILASITLK